MGHQDFKVKLTKTGGMRVDTDTHVQMYIQKGIASIYYMTELVDEVDVNKLNFEQLNNWIESKITEIKANHGNSSR